MRDSMFKAFPSKGDGDPLLGLGLRVQLGSALGTAVPVSSSMRDKGQKPSEKEWQ